MQKLSSKLVLLLTLMWWQASPAVDLTEVYRLALKNDAELMIAESDYLATIQALPLAESGRLPQISFNAIGQTREADNSETGTNSSDNLGYGVNLTQSLYDTEIRGDIRVAESNSAAALARLKSIRQDLILRVSESYFGILAAEDNVEFAYAERNAIARQLEQAQKRFEVGLIAITDVQEAQASFDNSEAQVILAENILENAFQSLVVLTADTSIRKLTPLGENLKLSLPNPATVQSWVFLALNNNLDLLAAQYRLDAARYERDKETRNGYPTVDLVASYEDNDRSNDLLGEICLGAKHGAFAKPPGVTAIAHRLPRRGFRNQWGEGAQAGSRIQQPRTRGDPGRLRGRYANLGRRIDIAARNLPYPARLRGRTLPVPAQQTEAEAGGGHTDGRRFVRS